MKNLTKYILKKQSITSTRDEIDNVDFSITKIKIINILINITLVVSKTNIFTNEERVLKKFCIDIDFELNQELIYYIDDNTRKLYLLIAIEKNIFCLAYNEN